jgi:predicted O-linked N-acetylglucosamine transferase (SPINDLY family)
MNRKERRAALKKTGSALPRRTGPSQEIARLASLAGTKYAAGALVEAAQVLLELIELAPKNPTFHANLAVILEQLGKIDESIASCRRAIALDPDHPDAFFNLGIALSSGGRLAAARAAYRQAIARRPDDAQAHSGLAGVLYRQGRHDDAAAVCRLGIALVPDVPNGHLLLASALKGLGRMAEAVAEGRLATVLDPGGSKTLADLGAQLIELGQAEQAVAVCRRAVAVTPELIEARLYLGAALAEQGSKADAVRAFEDVLTISPDCVEALRFLGQLAEEQTKLGEAAARYRQALTVAPPSPETLSSLGDVLQYQGRLDEARTNYQRAIAVKPDHLVAFDNLLMCHQYAASSSNAQLLATAAQFGALWASPPAPESFPNRPDPGRRLRIGYVSPDFATHPVGYFLAPVLPAHDRAAVEVFCYSNRTAPDAMTERLRTAADHWRTIVQLPDVDAAQLVRQDGIDILVDLAGHTAANRLGLFAIKPAPVQVSWLGYSGTTGLSAIDYILADRTVVPPGEEAFFVESVWRLPDSYLCYAPPSPDPAPGPFPFTVNGFVTFGCFNNRPKITAEAIAAWALILQRVEKSRLFLKAKSFADADCRAALLGAFADHGIGGQRLVIEAHWPQAEALKAYDRIDIALDTFPFGGTATTVETLWMGVPLITLRGGRWVGRVSHSVLASLGLHAWVAESTEHYVEAACRLAADLPNLASLRAGLRRILEHSALCDGTRFARHLEAAYRSMWHAWCDRTR